ncbi:hypothetical protein A0H81_12564 [Grifola frondosa]|uniref:Uncharacterized protein n=1 Tax=Grifola frondosa TaxID=5627 RepID=A0A1C7LRS5_GRIFR|nr:hypothetical protein A0H81_12564 [Grifola frondosa]
MIPSQRIQDTTGATISIQEIQNISRFAVPYPSRFRTLSHSSDNRTHFPPRQDSTSAFVTQKKKYKPVALKVRPVLATLPNRFRIVRNIQGDPLADMPPLDPNPPTFNHRPIYPSTSRRISQSTQYGISLAS